VTDPVHPQAPFIVPFECDAGAAWSVTVQLCNPDAEGNPNTASPYNLTGYTFKCSVKGSASKSAKPTVEITVTPVDLTLGKIKLSLTAAQTSGLAGGDYYYDLAGKTASIEPRYFMAGTFEAHARASKF
jgi:hypothetical protein